MSQSWLIASGKGGVGKTSITAALAIALAKRQLSTVTLDGDIGLRNLDIVLGLEGKIVFDVMDVTQKDCKLRSALVQDTRYPALSLLPASQMGKPSDLSPEMMERVVGKLRKRFTYVLMDSPAGLGKGFLNLVPAADHTLLITTPDDVAIRDAERVIALLEEKGKPRPMLILNRVYPLLVRSGDMYSPQTVANILDVPLLGFVPEDPAVLKALNHHESFMEGTSPAAAAIQRICRRFLGEYVAMPEFEKKKRRFFGFAMHG